MEGYWGMGSTIASHGVTHRGGIGGGGRPGAGGEGKERDVLKSSLAGRIEEKLDEIFQRPEKIIRENRLEVLAVTHALETNKTLTGDDIKAIVDGTPGPLVDGTEYHSPEFAEQAREYHRQVVIAHKEHASVDVPMPTLNGQRGPDFVAVDFPESPGGDGHPTGDDG
jgi:hypothetical protein